jgi:hypothetical protein
VRDVTEKVSHTSFWRGAEIGGRELMNIGWEWGVPEGELLFMINQCKRAHTFHMCFLHGICLER